MNMSRKGIVYLVGAGPGDPELLTVKARRLLASCDRVAYDHLVNPAILKWAPQAKKVCVGKTHYAQAKNIQKWSQEKITRLLIRWAKRGESVVRLKGGDPLMFGRGGEETEVLRRHNVSYEIVPGITAALAASSYAEISLTDRRDASSVIFLTGHEDPNKSASSIDWDAVAASRATIVVYMGMVQLPAITRRLMDAGMESMTPAAVVSSASLSQQRTITGTLATIARDAQRAGIQSPALCIVGSVIRHRRESWFESKPLFNQRVMVTRSREQAGLLSEKLQAYGADVSELPAVEITGPTQPAALTRVIRRLDEFDWLVFTSQNGVRYFFQALGRLGKDARSLAGRRVAAIGPATALALAERGIQADCLPRTYISEDLARTLVARRVAARRVLLIRTAGARDILPKILRRHGANVQEVHAYAVRPSGAGRRDLKQILSNGGLNWLTFASARTVESFLKLVGHGTMHRDVLRIPCACIGPVTARAARKAGFKRVVVARKYTMDGLVKAMVKNSR